MILYHAYLRHGMPRRLPHEIYEAALGGTTTARRLPSDGLSPAQVLTALHEMSMSAGHIRLPATRNESRQRKITSLFGVMCRQVNSQMPPMIYSKDHAWIVVGYRVDDRAKGHDGTTLFIHNDVEGPYLPIATPFIDEMKVAEGEAESKTWRAAMPPLPRKLYMSGERAELIGRKRLEEFAQKYGVETTCSRRTPKTRSPGEAMPFNLTSFRRDCDPDSQRKSRSSSRPRIYRDGFGSWRRTTRRRCTTTLIR